MTAQVRKDVVRIFISGDFVGNGGNQVGGSCGGGVEVVLREVADGVRVPRLNWGEGIELPIFLFNILRLGLQKTSNALISSGMFHRLGIA